MRNPIYGLDRGDRKEVWLLLERLSEAQRMDWLRWCCTQTRWPDKVAAVGEGILGEVFECWKMLCHSMGLDMERSRWELEQRVRRYGVPIFWNGAIIGVN